MTTNNSQALVSNWSPKTKVYQIDSKSGALTNPRDRGIGEEVSGFFKTFRGLKQPLICYSSENSFWIQSGISAISLEDPNLEIKIKYKWPSIHCEIIHPKIHFKFKETKPLELLRVKLDPSFDSLDITTTLFTAYLFEQYDKARKQDSHQLPDKG